MMRLGRFEFARSGEPPMTEIIRYDDLIGHPSGTARHYLPITGSWAGRSRAGRSNMVASTCSASTPGTRTRTASRGSTSPPVVTTRSSMRTPPRCGMTMDSGNKKSHDESHERNDVVRQILLDEVRKNPSLRPSKYAEILGMDRIEVIRHGRFLTEVGLIYGTGSRKSRKWHPTVQTWNLIDEGQPEKPAEPEKPVEPEQPKAEEKLAAIRSVADQSDISAEETVFLTDANGNKFVWYEGTIWRMLPVGAPTVP